MGIGDRELDPDQPAPHQAAQKVAPKGLRFGLADVEADHLAAAGLVDAIGDHDALAANAAAVADLFDLGVEPQVWVAAVQGPGPERLDLLIEAGGDPRDLRAGDPEPERLDQLVDAASGDPADVGLLDDV